MGIELEAIAHHDHYDGHGRRLNHAPGDRYTVHDGAGFSAEQLAAAFIQQGVARLVTPTPKPKAKGTK